MLFPQGSSFLKINLGDKTEAAILDLLLDGTKDTLIGINNVGVPANTLQISQLTFTTGMAYVIISPRGAAVNVIPSGMIQE